MIAAMLCAICYIGIVGLLRAGNKEDGLVDLSLYCLKIIMLATFDSHSSRTYTEGL